MLKFNFFFRIRLLDERDKATSNSNPEIDQLRSLLEEKDRHINELMDTLNNFHVRSPFLIFFSTQILI